MLTFVPWFCVKLMLFLNVEFVEHVPPLQSIVNVDCGIFVDVEFGFHVA